MCEPGASADIMSLPGACRQSGSVRQPEVKVDSYELMKTLHVLSAVVWVGGAATIQVLAIRAQRAAEPGRMATFAKEAEWVGQRIFLPVSLLLLALGIGMVIEEEAWGFGDTWIVIGLVGIVFSALVGSAFLGPESGRVGKLMDAEGPESPEVTRRLRRLFLVSRIELAVLMLVVADMVIKPGL